MGETSALVGGAGQRRHGHRAAHGARAQTRSAPIVVDDPQAVGCRDRAVGAAAVVHGDPRGTAREQPNCGRGAACAFIDAGEFTGVRVGGGCAQAPVPEPETGALALSSITTSMVGVTVRRANHPVLTLPAIEIDY
jgi:hypothetical protein